MKTTKLLIPALTLIAGAAIAQPTITLSDMTPSFGTTLSLTSATYVSPGAAGANQNWDLSGMEAESTYSSVIEAPDNQPGHESFAAATHVMAIDIEESYGYGRYADNKIEGLGVHIEGFGTVLEYTNPRTHLAFPLAYNGDFSDTYASTMNIGEGMTAEETGTVTGLVDGYGTLTTPAGTFTDVLRIKIEASSQLILFFNGSQVLTSSSTETTYIFVKDGYPHELASLTETDTEGEVEASGEYLNVGPLSVETPGIIEGVRTFPSPAVDFLNVEINAKQNAEAMVNVYSLEGKLVLQTANSQLVSGKNTLHLNVSNLNSGFYLLQVSTPEGVRTEKFAVN